MAKNHFDSRNSHGKSHDSKPKGGKSSDLKGEKPSGFKGGKPGGFKGKQGKKNAFDDIDGGWMKKKVAGSKDSASSPSAGKDRKGASSPSAGKKGKSKQAVQQGGKRDSGRNFKQGSQRGSKQGSRQDGKQGKQAAKQAVQQAPVPQIPREYDFNDEPQRRGTNSLKWDVAQDELPMWVADMDIKTAPAITQALVDRASSGVFGYSVIDANYRQTVADWWQRRHGIVFEPEDVLFCNGVMPAIGSIIRTLTNPEDSVLVQPPVYNHFFSVITENGRNVVESPLDYDGKFYFINWEDLEEKLSAPEVTMMLLCNPQNPVGKVWDAEDLARIGELCSMHDVLVVSDEIHCDVVRPGVRHTPFAAASSECREISITCGSTSKAFNTAGIQSAYVICTDPQLREGVKEGMKIDEVSFPNIFAIDTVMAAYTECDQWLDDLNAHIQSNKEEAAHYIEQRLPEILVVPSDSTYLLWLDCMELAADATELCEAIREETGLVLCPGSIYGSTAEPFLRMNVACSKRQLRDALRRLDSFFNMYE